MSPLPTPPIRIPRPQRKWAFLALACVSVVLSLTTWFSATAVMPDLVARWGL
ncbi:MAG: hypothetical protein ACJAVS_002565, partial [Paracoccaceae bacterium]